MSETILGTFKSAVSRRGFVGQVAAGGAALATGFFGSGVEVFAHDERLTMAPATLGKQWGISTYRVRMSGQGSAETRIVAELLNQAGSVLGQFTRARHYRTQFDQQLKKPKRFLSREETQLSWLTETIELETDHGDGTFTVKYNGKRVGTVSPRPDRKKEDPAVSALIAQRGELLRIMDGVSKDLDQALPQPPVASDGCCLEIGCNGSEFTCFGYGALRSSACDDAQQCVRTSCWNSLCIGCCYEGGCDCACLVGDFICTCLVRGLACSCDRPLL